MPKRKPRTNPNVVPNSRYGNCPVTSGYTGTEEAVRESYWAYSKADIFVESAIPADTTKQNFATFPRGFYVDMLKTCRECDRKFIFFALEQRHWYEELGFYIDTDCVFCTECRNAKHDLREHFQRYSSLVSRDLLTDEELAVLVNDAVFLWNHEAIKNPHTLRRLKNLAVARMPESQCTEDILAVSETL